jgi:hypothetical protein
MEIWKSSPLAPAHVEVSSLGRVRTLDRAAPSMRAHQPTQTRAGKVLSPWLAKVGYLCVSIKEGGKRPKYLVHRLVAAAFCEGFAPGLSVNHIDGNKLNNLPENLEWVTLARNTALSWETGQSTAEAHATKLSPASASEIKARLRNGDAPVAIAADYGVSSSLVYAIKIGKRWAAAA